MPSLSFTSIRQNISRAIGSQVEARKLVAERRKYGGPSREITRADWGTSMEDPTEFYLNCHRYFQDRVPPALREHRAYFSRNRRGFGEEAFHVMWFLLFREFRYPNFLEIGVYRGQSLSLGSLLQRDGGMQCDVTGVSPFLATDFGYGKYPEEIDYYNDTLANFAHFNLPKPTLLRAFSTDPAARDLIVSRQWHAVYIDGNHDYPVALADWNLCAENTAPGGIIVLDDAGLTTHFQPPLFASKGIDGPSRLAMEVDRKRFQEIMQVGHNRVFQKL
jgi:hypothetical protein